MLEHFYQFPADSKGAAVYGSAGDHHLVLKFGSIIGPLRIQLNCRAYGIKPQDRAVKRANLLNFIGGNLRQQTADLGSILSANVAVIPSGLVFPGIDIAECQIFRASSYAFLNRSETSESIGTEKHMLLRQEADHNLRPMHHRSGVESKAGSVQVQALALGDGKRAERVVL